MKKLLCTILSVLILLLPAFALAEDEKIVCQGRASVFAKPDIATVYIGISFEDEHADKAQELVNDVTAKAKEAILALGVAETDIVTESVSISTIYDWSSERETVAGFRAYTTMSVRLTDVTLIGQTVDAALTSGANNLSGISYETSQRAAYYDEALVDAVGNAMHKAEIIASAAGRTVSTIDSVTEQYSSGMYAVESYAEDTVAAPREMGGGMKNATAIDMGLIEVSASVECVFAMTK